MMLSDMRKMIIAAAWPAEAIATGAKLPLNVVRDFLDDVRDIAPADMVRLQGWIDAHSGQSSTGTLMFDKYAGTKTMAPIVAPATIVGKHANLEYSPILAITDADKTEANMAKVLVGRGDSYTGIGERVTPSMASKVAERSRAA